MAATRLAGRPASLPEKAGRPERSDPGVSGAILRVAAIVAYLALLTGYLAALRKNHGPGRTGRRRSPHGGLRDPARSDAAMQPCFSCGIAYMDGFGVLRGQSRKCGNTQAGFQFIRGHFDQIVSGRPSVFATTWAPPAAVRRDSLATRSRGRVAKTFRPAGEPIPASGPGRWPNAETIDLCIAEAPRESSRKEFLGSTEHMPAKRVPVSLSSLPS